MPFERPSVQDILARMQSDFKTILPDFDPFLPRSVLLALIHSTTAAVHELNGRLERASRNHFADTAELEELDRIGEIHGVPRGFGAKAAGTIVYWGNVGVGIPVGTFWVTANGDRYVSNAGGQSIGGFGVGAFDVESVEVGSRFNLPATSAIELEEPITGLTPGSGAVGASPPIEGGTDDELVEDFRARVLQQIRRRPQGGTLTDFERWVKESDPNWTRVFVLKPATGSNLIQMYAVDDSLDPDGDLIVPAGTEYTDSLAYVDADHRRPLCADAQLDAPVLVTLDPSITLVPNTTVVQDAVKAEVREMLIRVVAVGGTLFKSELDAAISRGAGETDHTTTVPAGNTVLSADEVLTPGTFTFS